MCLVGSMKTRLVIHVSKLFFSSSSLTLVLFRYDSRRPIPRNCDSYFLRSSGFLRFSWAVTSASALSSATSLPTFNLRAA